MLTEHILDHQEVETLRATSACCVVTGVFAHIWSVYDDLFKYLTLCLVVIINFTLQSYSTVMHFHLHVNASLTESQ